LTRTTSKGALGYLEGGRALRQPRIAALGDPQVDRGGVDHRRAPFSPHFPLPQFLRRLVPS
jgi:hypothetical protein